MSSLQWRRERPRAGESARLVADGYEITRLPLGSWTTWVVDESLPNGRRAIAGGMVKPATAKQAADAHRAGGPTRVIDGRRVTVAAIIGIKQT